MTLRSPSFLDLETLLSQAEYHDIDVPVVQDIVETTVSKRSGGGKAGLGAIALSGSAGSPSRPHMIKRDEARLRRSPVVGPAIVIDAIALY